MTALARDIRSVVTVGLVVGGIALAFPRGAIGFRAREVPSVRAASAAFVTLTDAETAAALKAAKTAWQVDAATTRRLRVQLPLGDLPEEDLVRPFALDPPRPAVTVQPVPYGPQAFCPSCAAAAPKPRETEPVHRAEPAFSREELLGFSLKGTEK